MNETKPAAGNEWWPLLLAVLTFSVFRRCLTAINSPTPVKVQAAIKQGIQQRYQLEPNELAADPLPSYDDRNILFFYEAAEGGAIGLVEEGDPIHIDIPKRSISLGISEAELQKRRREMESRGATAFRPGPRDRKVSAALRAYAAMTTSADKGAVRDLSQLD